MSMQTKTIGRMPTDHGPYDPQLAYGKKFQCTLFGCAWESLHDNNNTAPAVWDGGDTITPNQVDWKKVSGSYEAWLMNKDKPASTGTTGDYPYNGMGHVVLKKNMVNVADEGDPEELVNLLTQDMFYKGEVGSRVPNTNTVFVIKYDFVLGENISIPANCVLVFCGGSIKDDGTTKETITGNNTRIISGLEKIFSTGCKFEGSWKLTEVYPEWFGAKGDFNFTTNTGTDDSLAITAALSAATTMRANKIKLSSSQYYIGTGINLYDGDITIEGVNGLLREEATFNGIYEFADDSKLNNYKPSSLVSTSCQKVFRIDDKVTHPVRFCDVNFINIPSVNNNYTAIGISFESEFGGPTWPFIVERCHFEGFDKAICFDAENLYCAAFVRMWQNSFTGNNYCVYFKEQAEASHSLTRCFTWGFDFRYNTCHHNACVLEVAVDTLYCIVNENNLEGNGDKFIDGTTFNGKGVCTLYLSNAVKLQFCYNHYESISATPLSIVRCLGGYMANDNNIYVNVHGNTKSYISAVVDVYSTDANAIVRVESCDYKVRCKQSSTLVFPNELSELSIDEGVDINLCFNKMPTRKVVTPVDISLGSWPVHQSDCIMNEGDVLQRFPSSSVISSAGNIPVRSTSFYKILSAIGYNCNTAVCSVTDGAHTDSVANLYIRGTKYACKIIHIASRDYSSSNLKIYSSSMAAGSYVSAPRYYEVVEDPSYDLMSIIASTVPESSTSINNASVLSNITGVTPGNILFAYTEGKSYLFSGTWKEITLV